MSNAGPRNYTNMCSTLLPLPDGQAPGGTLVFAASYAGALLSDVLRGVRAVRTEF